MELELKKDFDKVLARFEAWWRCEIVDRPLASLRGRPRRAPAVPTKRHATLRDRWMDIEFAIDRFEAGLDGAEFLGESYPMYYPNIGPEIVGALFGCELEFGETTSWSRPAVKSCRDILKLTPDFGNEYWAAIRRATDLSLARGKGKWITGLTDLHTNGDLLASLRDPEEVCMDLADDIEGVRAACEHVTKFFAAIYEDCAGRCARAGQPVTTTWLPALHGGKCYATSCDLICMISPKMFERTILPSLIEEMRYLDRNIFHLDGPGALKHLDALLDLPELNGIQWVYGAGRGSAKDWISVYQRIQSAGKCMMIACDSIADAKAVMEHIRPEGAWFSIGGQYTSDEANAFLKGLERWAAGKRM
ncbi:MAG: hypothetical protein ACE15C_07740 [Phycisphaerae bacterium]